MHNPLDPTNPGKQASADDLRRLPTELPPPYNWQEFRRRSELRAVAAKGGVGWKHMAAAAALLVMVMGVAIWSRVGTGGRHAVGGTGHVLGDSASSTERAGHQGQGTGGPVGDLDALREVQRHDVQAHDVELAATRVRAIESWLATLPREPVVVRVGPRADVARLEDRIAQVDDLLTSVRLDGRRPDSLVALQRERVRLVGSLAQVRYAEVLASESP